MQGSERRLAAIMFTDMVGYTALAQTDESLALRVLERHNQLLKPIFPRFRGREIKTLGDSFLVEFDSALDATNCAIDVQRFLHDYNISARDDWRITLRIGVHLGDVVHSSGDVFGDAVNVASRIQPLADPEGICVSQQVYDQVRNKLTNPFEKLERRDLKNVQFPLDVYKVLLPWEKPGSPVETVAPSSTRLAILPLANFSPDPTDEYFADGLTEELISTVSSLSQLSVISRTSVMGYKKTGKRIPEIGRELNAGTVLEGSVRKADNQVRVTVQLIDVNKDKHLWAETYDRELKNVFALQSDIAKRVADALKVRVLPTEKVEIEKQPTLNSEAHVLYLKGRHHWNQRTKESLLKGIEYFQCAVDKDPNFALGYAGLADSYMIRAHNMHTEAPAVAKAKEYLRRALELDDNLAEAHTTLASILFDVVHDVASAEVEFRKAIKLKPNYATAHQWYGMRLNLLGRNDESLAELKKALELDPLSPVINENFGDYYSNVGAYDQSIDQYKKTIDLFPEFLEVHFVLALPYVAKSMFTAALKTVEDYTRLGGDELEAKLMKANIYAWMNKRVEARQLLAEVESTEGVDRPHDYGIAIVHFALGDDDVGFEWLERMYQSQSMQTKFIVTERELDHVRNDKRYVSLLKRLGLADPQVTSSAKLME